MSMSKYTVDVPEGVSGIWKVSRFSVGAKDAQWGALFGKGRHVPQGTYTALHRGGTIVMSDTPDEIRDHLFAVGAAKGHCLVVGLGLGMVAQAMLSKPEVEHVTIIEKSPDVIQLVGPWLSAKFPGRVTIIEADVLKWEPPKGARWDVAWFDIWDNICADNLDEMKVLHRKFGRRAGWKGSWARERCELQAAQWARSPWNRAASR
jgi:hypothetical protein